MSLLPAARRIPPNPHETHCGFGFGSLAAHLVQVAVVREGLWMGVLNGVADPEVVSDQGMGPEGPAEARLVLEVNVDVAAWWWWWWWWDACVRIRIASRWLGVRVGRLAHVYERPTAWPRPRASSTDPTRGGWALGAPRRRSCIPSQWCIARGWRPLVGRGSLPEFRNRTAGSSVPEGGESPARRARFRWRIRVSAEVGQASRIAWHVMVAIGAVYLADGLWEGLTG